MLRYAILIFAVHFTALLCAQQNTLGADKKLQTKVSVKASNITLDAVFEQLSNQSGYYFTYNAEQINGNQLINASYLNITIEQALDTLLQNPELTYELVNNQIIIHPVSVYSTKIGTDINKSKSIKGIIIGADDKIPLPFASIVIKNSYYGAISNKNGEFTFRIPEKFLKDTLEFSYIGYHSKQVAITDLESNVKIELSTGNVSLQEVIVRSIEPKELLRKARAAINENYYDKAYNYEAFYREAVKKGSDYRLYSEALIYGFKPSFKSGNITNKVQIIKARKYNNIRQTDTLLVKLRGGMDGCFMLDLIHELPDFLQEHEEEIYTYNIHDIAVWKDELVYIVGFQQKDFISEPLFEGDIYITVDDHAILGADFSFSKKMIRKTRNLFVVKKTRQLRIRPISTQYKVQYANYNGRYYTEHVRGELTFKAKKSRQLIHDNYTTLMEMVYTQIDTTNVIKPERKSLFQTHSVFSDSEQVYNDFYWMETNIINPEPDILKALKSSGFKVQEEGLPKD